MNERAITAKTLEPGDIITQGTLPNGTVATVDVHEWTVTVTYTDGREAFTSVLAILHIEPIGDHVWVHSVPTLTVGQECAICDRPRAEHEMEEGEH